MMEISRDMTVAQKLDALASSLETQQAVIVSIAVLVLERAGQGPPLSSEGKEMLLMAIKGFASAVIRATADSERADITPPEKN